jgi:hypothetical protein
MIPGLLLCTTGDQALAYAARIEPGLVLLSHLVCLPLPPTQVALNLSLTL